MSNKVFPLQPNQMNDYDSYWYVFDELTEDVYYFYTKAAAKQYAIQMKFTKYFIDCEDRSS